MSGGAREARDQAIDRWRAVAIVMVMLYHYTDRLPLVVYGYDRRPLLHSPLGLLGVEIFFVISAFLLAPAAARAPQLGGFLARRIARIVPLLALAATTIFLVTRLVPPPLVAAGPYHFDASGRTLADLAGTILLLGDFGFRWIDGAYWSLLVEMKFYVLLAVLVAMAGARFDRWLALIAAGLAAAYLACLAAAGPVAAELRSLLVFLTAPYLPFFALGALWARNRRGALLLANVLLAVALVAVKIAQQPAVEPGAAAASLGLLLALIIADRAFAGGRILPWIGHYSYAIYLFHQVLGLMLLVRLGPLLDPDLAILMTMLAIMALARLASFVAEYRFQSRLTKWLTPILSFGPLARSGPETPWRAGKPADPSVRPLRGVADGV